MTNSVLNVYIFSTYIYFQNSDRIIFWGDLLAASSFLVKHSLLATFQPTIFFVNNIRLPQIEMSFETKYYDQHIFADINFESIYFKKDMSMLHKKKTLKMTFGGGFYARNRFLTQNRKFRTK